MKKPNQAPEPMRTAVTPRAVARVAPSTRMAHLERSANPLSGVKKTIACLLGIVGCLGIAACSLYVLAYSVWRTAAAQSPAELKNAHFSVYVCLAVLVASLAGGVAIAVCLRRISKKMKHILAQGA